MKIDTDINKVIWGGNFVEYFIICNKLSKLRKENYVLGINGPIGIGKRALVRKICKEINRKFIAIDYAEISQNCYLNLKQYIGENPNKSLLIYIEDTAFVNGYYVKEVRCFAEHLRENKLGDDTIFLFSSNAVLGYGTGMNANFRVFQYGRLSMDEKMQYAHSVIMQCQLEFGLSEVCLPNTSIEILVKYYTREPGINYLTVLIKNIYEIIFYNSLNCNSKVPSMNITNKMIFQMLGSGCNVFDQQVCRTNLQGIGMAWTKWGGVLLPIHMEVVKGQGKVIITGNVGNLMKESVEVVFQYLKTHRKVWNVSRKYFERNDFYISLSNMSLLKDGVSAGLSFLVKLICTIKQIKLKYAIAFSGEVTLEGRVLRVGGIKEKLCTAFDHGIEKFVLPKQSWPEYKLLPEEFRKKITVQFVDNVVELAEIIEAEKKEVEYERCIKN